MPVVALFPALGCVLRKSGRPAGRTYVQCDVRRAGVRASSSLPVRPNKDIFMRVDAARSLCRRKDEGGSETRFL